MKYLFLLLLSGHVLAVHSQGPQSSTCFILYVKGEIKKPSGQKLIQGDTILFEGLAGLQFETPDATVNVFESKIGSFRMTRDEITVPKKHESFFIFLTHLLKVKGHPVSLSSRGDCHCVTPQACFLPDTNLNDKVLLTDELSFRANEVFQKSETAAYYINYNGQKRILRVTDGSVLIGKPDLVFKDTAFTIGETPELILGLYLKTSEGVSNDLLAKVRFQIVPDSVLVAYYKTLELASGEKDLIKLRQKFIDDVYLYFGKPSECQIDKIINTTKD